jgi:uncharacterized protein YjgD (DUF1641 family)
MFLFRKTNSFSIGSGYVDEISNIQDKVFDMLENKITANLLKNLNDFRYSDELLKREFHD